MTGSENTIEEALNFQYKVMDSKSTVFVDRPAICVYIIQLKDIISSVCVLNLK